MRAVGVGLICLAVTMGLTLRFASMEGDVLLIANIINVALFVFGAFLFYRGKQYAARAKAREARRDERAPVIYLRPFAKDQSMASQVFTGIFIAKLLSGFATDEEQLAEVVEPIGPLVAIGRPGERLPKPGAIRTYATDAEWKDVVTKWLSIARLVIVRPGTTRGVWWEMEQAFAVARPDRVLLILISASRADCESISRSVQDRFSIALPPLAAFRRWGRVSGFFEFGADWSPRSLCLISPEARLRCLNLGRHSGVPFCCQV